MTENPMLKVKTKLMSKIFKKVTFLSPVKTGLSPTSVGEDQAKKEKKRTDFHGDINTFVSTMISSHASPRSTTQTTKRTTPTIKTISVLSSYKPGLLPMSVGNREAKEEMKRANIHGEIDTKVLTMTGSHDSSFVEDQAPGKALF